MDSRQRADHDTWYYEMEDLGYNYRITDFQCALGLSQLQNLPAFLERRRQIAAQYNESFSRLPEVEPLGLREDVLHAYHLYVVKTKYRVLNLGRAKFFGKMKEKGVNVNVHYIPVHMQPFYREHFNTHPGLCSVAETAYEAIISLPIFPAMKAADVHRVITATNDTVEEMREEAI